MDNYEEIPEIIVIGLSHKTASVDMRERFSLGDEEIEKFLDSSCEGGIQEIVFVSTCNRVEIYLSARDVYAAIENVICLLEDYTGQSRDIFDEHLYKKYSKDAVLHLLTVASSLDSMVIGENEILGQIKTSYTISVKGKKTGIILNRLFHQAFNTAKKVRTETEISQNPLSIAYIASELAKQIFEDLSKRSALLIGAGEMGELILKYFTKNNINAITIANRSLHNAERIADEINADSHIIPLEDIQSAASEVDIIISSATSRDYIISVEMIKSIVKKRGNRPLFMIDISVPRNIDPQVSKLQNIFLYNIDDLKTIADENLKNRLKEVEIAKELIDADVNDFFKWYEELAIVPAIMKIQNRFNEIRKNELKKYRRRKLKHLSDKDFEMINDLTRQIMTKTLHNPIMSLKRHQASVENTHSKKESLREKTRFIEDLFEQ